VKGVAEQVPRDAVEEAVEATGKTARRGREAAAARGDLSGDGAGLFTDDYEEVAARL
jgi:hypothetical protein